MFEKYSEYRDSGTNWLGKIPKGWDLIKAKYIWNEKIDLAKDNDEVLLSVSQYLGVNNREVESRSESLAGYKKVDQNDLVINIMLAWLGGLGLSSLKGVVSPAYGVYKLMIKADPRFLHYLYRTNIYLDEFARRSRGVVPSRWRMYTEDFGQVLTLLPSEIEQTAIANFLDRKTAQIDQAISIKEKQIELLKERRKILIHNAVTRGLDPDVKMKDSGVEWIGEIPGHWELVPLRFLGKCQNGVSKGGDYFGSGYPFVNYGDVYRDVKLPFEVEGLAESSNEDRIHYSVKEGDVFFTRTSETVEEIAFASTCLRTIENGIFSGFLIRFRPERNVLKKRFSKYYFSSRTHRAFFVKEMNLVIRASLS